MEGGRWKVKGRKERRQLFITPRINKIRDMHLIPTTPFLVRVRDRRPGMSITYVYIYFVMKDFSLFVARDRE